MRLVNYGVGEVADRLTILSLKLLFGGEAGKDITHFRNEQTVLFKTLSARLLNAESLKAVLELAAVNAALWHAEDDLREMRGHDREPTPSEVIAKLAFRIQQLNDTRAGLVGAINKSSGDGAAGLEKV